MDIENNKDKKTKTNNKKLKTMLVSFLVLIILGGSVIALKLTDDNENKGDDTTTETTAPTPSSAPLLNLDNNSVISVKIESPQFDEYTIINKDNTFKIKELEEMGANSPLPYNSEALSNLFGTAVSISSLSVVEENAPDLEKYNLSDDNFSSKITISSKTESGDTVDTVYLIGVSPFEDTVAYLRLWGESNVYSVSASSVNPFLSKQMYDWLSLNMFPKYDSDTAPTVKSVKVDRTDLDSPIIIESIPELPLEELKSFNSHRLISPISLEVDPEKSTPAIYGIFDLAADSVLWVSPDEVDFELTGLNSPACTVEVELEGVVHTLKIGNEHEGGEGRRYALSSHSSDLLFLVNPDNLPWLEVNPEELIAEMFLIPYIYSLDRFDIATSEHALSFTITGDSENNSVSLEGSTLPEDERERFGDLYRFAISAKGESIFKSEDDYPEKQKLVTFSYHYRSDNQPTDTVEIYSGNDRKSIIKINGKEMFTCKSIYTSRLIENVNAFVNGNEIITDY